MAVLLAIDPSPIRTGWVLYNTDRKIPMDSGICTAAEFRDTMLHSYVADAVVIETVESFGMAVGKSVFDTVEWIGRFLQVCEDQGIPVTRMPRREVKLHLCNSCRAKDGNIRQACMDRYGSTKDAAIGKKASPGLLHGFKGDMWAALALALTLTERS